MHGDLAVEAWREHMNAIISGLSDDLGPEQTRRALKAHGVAVPGDDDEDEAHERG